MKWLKVGILMIVFLMIVAAGVETAESGMGATVQSVAYTSDGSNLHQFTVTCNRFLQNVARTIMNGVVTLLD
jgi:hypothetical protein